MQNTSVKMNKTIEGQVYRILYQTLGEIKTVEEMEITLKAILTENELMTIAKRLAIGVFLDKGQSYEHIGDVLKVSSATIANVAELMNKKGMQQAINRIKAEEWADVWSIKISRALEKLLK